MAGFVKSAFDLMDLLFISLQRQDGTIRFDATKMISSDL